MRASRWIAAPLVAAAAATAHAAWTEIRSNETTRLSIDVASIHRRGDVARFAYLIDYARPQGDFKTVFYRSLRVRVAMRCKARTIAITGSDAYSSPQAKGVLVARMKPMPADRRFQPIEAGTSDEDLWQYVCGDRKPRR